MSTQFSFEVPIKHLEDFDEDQDILFTLSFLFKRKEYFNYVEKFRNNRLVILDNSYNETDKADGHLRMVNLFNKIDADRLIAPDDNNWDFTQLRDAYCKIVKKIHPQHIWVIVRHPREYEWAKSKHYCTSYFQRAILPPKIIKGSAHFLGLVNIKEIKQYKPISCDTGMPIKLAMLGLTMQDWVKEGCPHIRTTTTYFSTKLSIKQIELAKRNIKYLKEV